MKMETWEALPGRGPMSLVWNFKTSCVGVYKCFMLLSKIERKFFVFVGILEKGIEIRCEETVTVLQFLS